MRWPWLHVKQELKLSARSQLFLLSSQSVEIWSNLLLRDYAHALAQFNLILQTLRCNLSDSGKLWIRFHQQASSLLAATPIIVIHILMLLQFTAVVSIDWADVAACFLQLGCRVVLARCGRHATANFLPMLDGGSAGAWVDFTDVLGGHEHAFALVCLFKLRVLLSIDKASWIRALLN